VAVLELLELLQRWEHVHPAAAQAHLGLVSAHR
jgi:hypothetical protein